MTTEKTTGDLLSNALNHVSSLVRSEVDLARAEIDSNLSNAGAAIGLLVGAVIVFLTSLNVLSAALVVGLNEAGVPDGWAPLIVGIAFAVIGYAMLKKGTNDLKLRSLAPTRTAKNVKRDAIAVKEAYND